MLKIKTNRLSFRKRRGSNNYGGVRLGQAIKENDDLLLSIQNDSPERWVLDDPFDTTKLDDYWSAVLMNEGE